MSPLLSGITQDLLGSFRPLNILPASLTQRMIESVSVEFDERLRSLLKPIQVHPKARVAERLGWVVHNTLPISLLEDTDEDGLDEAIMTFYRENSDELQRDIETAARGYLVDQDSKETMNQILSAHEHGLYRLVPPAMAAEIERATRVQLRGKMVDRGLNIKKTILSKVDDLPISSFHDITSGTIQYETLDNHLYNQIDDEMGRSKFAENPIPNRHAIAHGLVSYSSEKSSLNSIFLTDFVFLMITEIKKEWISEVTELLKDHIQTVELQNQGDSSFPRE